MENPTEPGGEGFEIPIERGVGGGWLKGHREVAKQRPTKTISSSRDRTDRTSTVLSFFFLVGLLTKGGGRYIRIPAWSGMRFHKSFHACVCVRGNNKTAAVSNCLPLLIRCGRVFSFVFSPPLPFSRFFFFIFLHRFPTCPADSLGWLKHNKAPGTDGIAAELVKNGGARLENEIHQIVTEVWDSESMPCD